MIDYARITVIAGRGGDGAGSFVHVKGKRRGKADGGDGGSGGNVYFEATVDLNTLEAFRYAREYRAQHGGNGASNRRTGATAGDLSILVPVGTEIKITNDKLQMTNSFDLAQYGQKVLIARGGVGGRGNMHLRDDFGRRPLSGEKGEEGEEVNLTLELKLIADVGLVGLPNAGKSTLLAKITSASPKIAPYPFTTLEPNLGVMESSSSIVNRLSGKKVSVADQAKGRPLQKVSSELRSALGAGERLVIADIPGLIEGASDGRGLGDLFLRHIERTRILAHLIDVSASDDAWESYQTIRNELKAYGRRLPSKKEIIVFNKVDLTSKQDLEDKIVIFKKKRKKVLAISAQTGLGTLDLVSEIIQKLRLG